MTKKSALRIVLVEVPEMHPLRRRLDFEGSPSDQPPGV
jgi:hypothetical protein